MKVQINLKIFFKLQKFQKIFDFLSIDIDGCDYHIFEQLELFTPKIICIEFNHMIPNEVEFVQVKTLLLNMVVVQSL